MRTQVQKWGNSLAVRIPKAFAADLGVTLDSPVELSMKDGCLLVRPNIVPKYELKDLLSSVTPENLHTEFDIGPEVGNEAW
ncbi:MAG: AbrB/MazE/SpoVT family DNA-binding domain-containing protein [bacterium]|nr:AbrB/MazE/SpoVT family DNA-binding domain-containing protein [bacterium]